MKTYARLAFLLTLLVIPSCSDDSSKACTQSDSGNCPKCETCEVCRECPTCKEGSECPACPAPNCPTCKEGSECPACNCQICDECPVCPTPSCPSCPTCKEGDECPVCPTPSCPSCPTCKEGDECPECNCQTCDECPACSTDELNSQLTACNNELTTTKQALETEQEANESCVGDLESCNADISELSARPRSKSGSRLIFKEHKMSDGSVYVELTPFDTKLGNACTFTSTAFGMCCIPGNAFVDFDITTFSYLYIDDNCSTPISALSPLDHYGVMAHHCAKIGDIVVRRGAYNYCSAEYDNMSIYSVKAITAMYQKQNNNCIKYESYPLVELQPASITAAKSFFVCEE